MKPAFLVVIFACAVGLRAASSAAPEQQSWAVLDQTSHAGNPELRMEAVSALESMGARNRKAVDRLTAFLKSDKDARVRRAAATSLGEMGARQSIPALRAALKDTDEVAFAAAQSLVKMGDPSGRAMVVDVMSGKRSGAPSVVTSAEREVERRFRHPKTLMLAGAASATGAAFPPALPGVAAVSNAGNLNSKRDPGSVAAVDCIAADPNPNNEVLLENALGNKHASVRAEVAKSLGMRGDSAAIPKLQPLLADPHSKVRVMAAAAIIRLSHPSEEPVAGGRMSATAAKP